MWSSSVVLCFIIGLVIVRFTHYWYRWSNPKCSSNIDGAGGRLPPGSMGFPLIGETLHLFFPTNSLDMPRFVKNRVDRYGKLFRTSLAGRAIVVSMDPEFNYFILQQERKLVELWYMDSFSAIFGGTINATTASAYIHKYIRNLISNYLGIESLKQNLLSKIEEMSNQGLQSWSSNNYNNNKSSSIINLKTSIGSMIFEWSSKELFDYDSTKSSENLSKTFRNFFDGLMTFPINIPGTAFHRCMKEQKAVVKLMKDILHERLNYYSRPEAKKKGDFLDQLIDDMKREEFLTEEFAAFLMFGLLLASFVSISATLTRTITLLTDHTSVAKELTEEHEAIIKSRENVDSPLTWNEYKSMTFTSQVINETLRTANIAPGILRKVIKDIHINGYVIPEGWTLMVVSSAIHMNPDKFKDPSSFNPWRWNEPGSNTSSKDFVPFGGGMRNCVGAEFTKAVMSVFLHVLVTKFSWTKIEEGGGGPAASSVGDGFHVKILKKKAIN